MFAREGARIGGCDNVKGRAEAAAAELAADGHDVTGSTVDLSDPNAAQHWVHDAAGRLGGMDVLYNNAAGFGFSPFADMTLELWQHVLHVELDIVFHMTSPARAYLRDGGDSIINTCSIRPPRRNLRR